MKSIQEETEEYQAVVDLLPATIDLVEQNVHKLSFICNPFRIKNLLNRLYSLVKLPIFNYELCLMTELVNHNNLEKGKIYLEKFDNNLKYILKDSNCNKHEGFIDINIDEGLTKENLNDNKSEILTTISNRGHIYAINHYRFSIVKIHLVYIRNIFETHVSNNSIINLKIISIIKQQEHAVRVYYKWLKESIESLQDLNRRIIKNLTKSVSDKIQSFLIRGASSANGKLAAGQLLSNIITDSNTDAKTVVESFCKLFIENAFSIIYQDQSGYQQLQALQNTIIQQIIEIDGLGLHDYFDNLVAHVTVHPYGYILVLLQNFCANCLARGNTFSQQYKDPIVRLLKFIAHSQENRTLPQGYIKEYSKLLAKVILLFSRNIFISTIENLFHQGKAIFQQICHVWVNISLEINRNHKHINKAKSQRIIDNLMLGTKQMVICLLKEQYFTEDASYVVKLLQCMANTTQINSDFLIFILVEMFHNNIKNYIDQTEFVQLLKCIMNNRNATSEVLHTVLTYFNSINGVENSQKILQIARDRNIDIKTKIILPLSRLAVSNSQQFGHVGSDLLGTISEYLTFGDSKLILTSQGQLLPFSSSSQEVVNNSKEDLVVGLKSEKNKKSYVCRP